MKKTTALILILVFFLVFAGGMYGMISSSRNDASYSFSLHQNLEIKDGKAIPEYASSDFGIDEEGDYNISLSWLPMGKELKDLSDLKPSDYSFITGCVISSEEDPCVYATTGGWLTIDGLVIHLKEGTYTVTFYYLTSREAYVEFAEKYFGTAGAETMADWFEWDQFKKDDKVVISYSNRIGFGGTNSGMGLWLLAIIAGMVGLVIVIVLWFVTKGAFDRSKYDERQQIERGRGSIYALYTMIGYMLILFMFDAVDLVGRDLLTPLYMGGLILGVTVSAVYSIWHECYFGLNRNKPRYMILMAVIALANIGSGIFDLSIAKKFGGSVYQGKLLRMGACAFELAVSFLVIAFVIFLKHRADLKEEEE